MRKRTSIIPSSVGLFGIVKFGVCDDLEGSPADAVDVITEADLGSILVECGFVDRDGVSAKKNEMWTWEREYLFASLLYSTWYLVAVQSKTRQRKGKNLMVRLQEREKQ